MREFTTINPEKFNGNFDNFALKHLLKRTLLGVSPDELNSFSGKNLDQVINLLLKEDITPLPPLNYYQSQTPDTTGVKLGETWIYADYGDGTINSRRKTSLRAWWLQRMIYQPPTIHEKMIVFWHNHFSTELNNYGSAIFGYKYQNTLRKFALKNFKDFIKAITLDPAMLVYLNGNKNTKGSADENYARELQELFTLGKAPTVKFTEEDVKNTAKVLTGYRVNNISSESYFQASQHDTSDKVFSDYYDKQTIKGKTGDTGQQELDDLITMIIKKDDVSLFLVRKLYIYFFYYDITPEVEQKFIVPMAGIYRANNYEIIPLLRAMLSSQHFFDIELHGALIKSPLEQVVGVFKELNPELPSASENIFENYLLTNDLVSVADRAQQLIGDPPSVSGWPAYYQAPNFHELWINASTLPERIKFSDTLIKNGYKRNGKLFQPDVIKFIKKLEKPEDPNNLIEELAYLIYQISISTSVKNQIKTDYLLDGQSSDYYWSELYKGFLEKPTSENTKMVTTKLRGLIAYMMSLPEYQLL